MLVPSACLLKPGLLPKINAVIILENKTMSQAILIRGSNSLALMTRQESV